MLTRPPVAEPLSFCMVTTFYPPHHFGGDAIYAYRLANALARRGHDVTVVHSEDAYRALGGAEPDGSFPHETGRDGPSAAHRVAARRRHGDLPHRPAGLLRGAASTGARAAASTSSTSTTSRSRAGRGCSATARE